ncbi:unnamed protein product [Pieris macdunnoughi]|uniref:Uncharacterized protein n=1 Tax=Pieris macdunnoughi TaxID=345717 RepID=A0A821Q9V9_9NEOP|nr:unnamed protein product [Pieris macdunnoughi]
MCSQNLRISIIGNVCKKLHGQWYVVHTYTSLSLNVPTTTFYYKLVLFTLGLFGDSRLRDSLAGSLLFFSEAQRVNILWERNSVLASPVSACGVRNVSRAVTVETGLVGEAKVSAPAIPAVVLRDRVSYSGQASARVERGSGGPIAVRSSLQSVHSQRCTHTARSSRARNEKVFT